VLSRVQLRAFEDDRDPGSVEGAALTTISSKSAADVVTVGRDDPHEEMVGDLWLGKDAREGKFTPCEAKRFFHAHPLPPSNEPQLRPLAASPSLRPTAGVRMLRAAITTSASCRSASGSRRPGSAAGWTRTR